jgi:hypothetical protein
MTKLFVRPLDPKARGSYRERSRLFAVIGRLEDAQKSQSVAETARVFEDLEKLMLPRLHTDDGTDVSEVLDNLSAEEFDALLGGLTGVADTVPLANMAT